MLAGRLGERHQHHARGLNVGAQRGVNGQARGVVQQAGARLRREEMCGDRTVPGRRQRRFEPARQALRRATPGLFLDGGPGRRERVLQRGVAAVAQPTGFVERRADRVDAVAERRKRQIVGRCKGERGFTHAGSAP